MGPSERASKLKVYVVPAITVSTLPQECDTLTLFASLQANGKWVDQTPLELGPKQVSRTIYRSPESGWRQERMQIRAISETAEGAAFNSGANGRDNLL